MVCQLINTNRSKCKSNKLTRSRSESPVSSLGRQSINRQNSSTTTTADQISDLLIKTKYSNNKSSSCTNLSSYVSNASFNLNYTLKTQTASTSQKDDLDDDLDDDSFNFNNSTTKSQSSLSTSQSEIIGTSDTQSILEQNISNSTYATSSSTTTTTGTGTSYSLKRQLSSNCSAAELVSLSSLTSNYSQFDFLNNENNSNVNLTTTSQELKAPLSSFAAFLTRFTSNKSKITSKPNDNHNIKETTNTGFMSGAFKLFTKTPVSETNVPNSVLIFENRPSNLPAKSEEEASKHRQEYEKMVANAKKKELKETQLKMKKCEQQLKKEDFMANSLKVWNTEIIPNWEKM
jgi:hypothetical protein